MAVDVDLVELRGMTPRAVIGVIDGYAHAKRTNRMAIVNRILLAWAKEQVHLTTVLSNATRGNPALPETGWGELE